MNVGVSLLAKSMACPITALMTLYYLCFIRAGRIFILGYYFSYIEGALVIFRSSLKMAAQTGEAT